MLILMNNLENKSKFFAQYWGQKILMATINGGGFKAYPIQSSEMHDHYFTHECWLELKPLSSITDEDAIWVSNRATGRISGHTYVIEKSATNNVLSITATNPRYEIAEQTWGCGTNWLPSEISDYLRFKGYALPWNGITVEQQIEFGWIKLKD